LVVPIICERRETLLPVSLRGFSHGEWKHCSMGKLGAEKGEEGRRRQTVSMYSPFTDFLDIAAT
jgi:hypothetical protein